MVILLGGREIPVLKNLIKNILFRMVLKRQRQLPLTLKPLLKRVVIIPGTQKKLKLYDIQG